MTWRDDYQQGSFRGVPFSTVDHERSGGRRLAVTEFPGRDVPLVEDMGRRARQFSLTCHVAGRDYRARRDALIEALEAPGPGLLIHPWHGQMTVAVQEYSSAEDQAGGICTFTLQLVEAAPARGATQMRAGQEAEARAKEHKATAPLAFARRFSIEGAAGFVEDAASALIDGMVAASQIAAGIQGGTGPALRAFEAGLRYLPGNVAALLRAPLHLGQAMVGMVAAVGLLGSAGRQRIAALTHLVDWQPTLPDFPDRTANRRREADNADALLWLFRSTAAAELAAAVAGAPFASYDDAVAARDAAAARLDRLATHWADAGDDSAAEAFDALRRALVRDLAVRVPGLARIYTAVQVRTEPALAVANRHYGAGAGAAAMEARAADIARRNRVAHPGFIPGGAAIRLLTAESVA